MSTITDHDVDLTYSQYAAAAVNVTVTVEITGDDEKDQIIIITVVFDPDEIVESIEPAEDASQVELLTSHGLR